MYVHNDSSVICLDKGSLEEFQDVFMSLGCFVSLGFFIFFDFLNSVFDLDCFHFNSFRFVSFSSLDWSMSLFDLFSCLNMNLVRAYSIQLLVSVFVNSFDFTSQSSNSSKMSYRFYNWRVRNFILEFVYIIIMLVVVNHIFTNERCSMVRPTRLAIRSRLASFRLKNVFVLFNPVFLLYVHFFVCFSVGFIALTNSFHASNFSSSFNSFVFSNDFYILALLSLIHIPPRRRLLTSPPPPLPHH